MQKNTGVEIEDNQSIDMSENGEMVYNKLVKFKNEIESTHKSSTTLSVDSAEWYAEAYYNVTQGYPDSALHSLQLIQLTLLSQLMRMKW